MKCCADRFNHLIWTFMPGASDYVDLLKLPEVR
jgi:hypothetical protein